MYRDLLGRRIKNNLSQNEIYFMEKFYIYNNKIFQIIRCEELGVELKLFFKLQVQDIDSKKIKYVLLKDIDLVDKVFFNTVGKSYRNLKQKCDGEYNRCCFENNDINLVEELYKLGYENFSRTTAYSYHTTKYSYIENNEILTTDEPSLDRFKYNRFISMINERIIISKENEFSDIEKLIEATFSEAAELNSTLNQRIDVTHNILRGHTDYDLSKDYILSFVNKYNLHEKYLTIEESLKF